MRVCVYFRSFLWRPTQYVCVLTLKIKYVIFYGCGSVKNSSYEWVLTHKDLYSKKAKDVHRTVLIWRRDGLWIRFWWIYLANTVDWWCFGCRDRCIKIRWQHAHHMPTIYHNIHDLEIFNIYFGELGGKDALHSLLLFYRFFQILRQLIFFFGCFWKELPI